MTTLNEYHNEQDRAESNHEALIEYLEKWELVCDSKDSENYGVYKDEDGYLVEVTGYYLDSDGEITAKTEEFDEVDAIDLLVKIINNQEKQIKELNK